MNRTKASTNQLIFLSEFMATHPEMASGHLYNTLQGRVEMEQQWVDLMNKLNSIGGPIKTVAKWKQAWRDLRYKVKKNTSHIKNEFQGNGPGSTDNGPLTIKPLSELENQVVLSVMGPVADNGMEEIVVTEATGGTDTQNTSQEDPLLYAELGPTQMCLSRVLPGPKCKEINLKNQLRKCRHIAPRQVKMNRTKASTNQLTFLSEFMATHPEMASGHLTNTLQERADMEQQWVGLMNKLNSIGGPIKTVTKWKQAWRDYKNNVKKKASHIKDEFRGYGPGSTGNGPITLKPSSEFEEQAEISSVTCYGMDEIVVTESTDGTGTQDTSQEDPLYVKPGPTRMCLSPLLPGPKHKTTNPKNQARKRRRIPFRQDNFAVKKILKLEEKKLKMEIKRNALLERIAGALESISYKIYN